jgi:hypothetical protein
MSKRVARVQNIISKGFMSISAVALSRLIIIYDHKEYPTNMLIRLFGIVYIKLATL